MKLSSLTSLWKKACFQIEARVAFVPPSAGVMKEMEKMGWRYEATVLPLTTSFFYHGGSQVLTAAISPDGVGMEEDGVRERYKADCIKAAEKVYGLRLNP